MSIIDFIILMNSMHQLIENYNKCVAICSHRRIWFFKSVLKKLDLHVLYNGKKKKKKKKNALIDMSANCRVPIRLNL